MDLPTARDYIDDLLLERNGLYSEIRGLKALLESITAENRKYILERGSIDGAESSEQAS